MKVLAVVESPEFETASVVRTLTERLRDRGSVATITRRDHDAEEIEDTDSDRYRSAGATRTVELASDGSWIASGENQTLDAMLDQLTVEYDYALVEGFSDTTLPTVVLGDHSATGDHVVATASNGADLDIEEVIETLEQDDSRETLESLVAQAKAASGSEFSGAIATFTGRVRERDHPDDTPTKHLEFEKYDTVAEQKMETIREELCEREGVYDVRLHHKTGVVTAGEDIVFVVVLAGHRDQAFATVSDGIDRLKAEVPLFKKEVTVDEEFWRHERTE